MSDCTLLCCCAAALDSPQGDRDDDDDDDSEEDQGVSVPVQPAQALPMLQLGGLKKAQQSLKALTKAAAPHVTPTDGILTAEVCKVASWSDVMKRINHTIA